MSLKKVITAALSRRVLRRLDLDLSDEVIRAVSNAKVKVVEKVLMLLRNQLDKAIDRTNALKQRTKQLHETLSKGKAEDILDIRESLLGQTSHKKVLEQGGYVQKFLADECTPNISSLKVHVVNLVGVFSWKNLLYSLWIKHAFHRTNNACNDSEVLPADRSDIFNSEHEMKEQGVMLNIIY